jgi:hypothetical protein
MCEQLIVLDLVADGMICRLCCAQQHGFTRTRHSPGSQRDPPGGCPDPLVQVIVTVGDGRRSCPPSGRRVEPVRIQVGVLLRNI